MRQEIVQNIPYITFSQWTQNKVLDKSSITFFYRHSFCNIITQGNKSLSNLIIESL